MIDIISHPIDGNCPLDYEAVTRAALEHHVLLEVNNHALRGPRLKEPAACCRELLRWCKKRELPVIMSSDAHHMCDIGNFDHAIPMLEEAGYPEELVLNRSAEDLLAWLAENRRREQAV